MARVVLSAGIVIAGTSAAHAAAWIGSAQGSVHAGYDDNMLMSVQPLPETKYLSTDLSADLALKNESLSWTLDPRVVIAQYEHYSIYNRTESYLTSSLQRETETGNSSLLFNWTQDTTLTSELGLTGLEEVNKRHQSTAVTLLHTEQWTERFDTQGSVYVTANHYMDAQYTGLVNYNYGDAELSTSYALTPRSQLSLDASVGKLQVPGLSLYGKTNQSVMLSYSTSFAERWQVKLSVGPSQVRSDFSKESGTLYEFDISRKSETASLALKIARDITPTGQGVLSRRKQLTLTARRDITQRINASISGSLIQNDSLLLSNSFNFYGVRYSDVNVNLNWRCALAWTLSLKAGHTEQRVASSELEARRNYVSLSLSWSGLAHTLH